MKSVRFLHIPKTAGNTFTSIISRQYLRKTQFVLTHDAQSDDQRYSQIPQCIKDDFILFTGHAPISSGNVDADNAVIITLLRDPISRVKSFCQYVSEGKCAYLKDSYPPERFDLDAFLDSGVSELSNLQAKMLISDRNYTLFDQLNEHEAGKLALKNLFEKISLFGIQEYFDESLLHFMSALNWRIPLYVSQNKQNKKRLIQFDNRHFEKIESLNQADMFVYNCAKEHFVESVMRELDQSDIKRFRIMNKFAYPVVKIENRIIRLNKILT